MITIISHKTALKISNKAFKRLQNAYKKASSEVLILIDERKYRDITTQTNRLMERFGNDVIQVTTTTNVPHKILADLYMSCHQHPCDGTKTPWSFKYLAKADESQVCEVLQNALAQKHQFSWEPHVLEQQIHQNTIAFDMDDVIKDIRHPFKQWQRDLNLQVGFPKYKVSENFPPQYKKAIEQKMEERGFFESLPAIPGILETLKKLKREHQFHLLVCSSPMTTAHCAHEKFNAVRKVFGDLFDGIIITRKKYLAYASVLVDDLIKHAKKSERAPWQLIMMRCEHNQNTNWPHIMDGPKDVQTLLSYMRYM